MANTCNSRIIFTGDNEVLKELMQKLTKKANNKVLTLSYELIDGLVPSINNDILFKDLGFNYNMYVLNRYSEIEKNQADISIKNYLEENNFIGTENDFINHRIWEFKTSLEKNKLKINLSSAWSCPINFFIYVAEKFNLKVMISESIEGNYTSLYYPQNGTYTEARNSLELILTNSFFRKMTLKAELYNKADLALAAYLSGDISLCNRWINKYGIKKADFDIAIAKEHNRKESFYGVSLIHFLEKEEIEENSILSEARDFFTISLYDRLDKKILNKEILKKIKIDRKSVV